VTQSLLELIVVDPSVAILVVVLDELCDLIGREVHTDLWREALEGLRKLIERDGAVRIGVDVAEGHLQGVVLWEDLLLECLLHGHRAGVHVASGSGLSVLTLLLLGSGSSDRKLLQRDGAVLIEVRLGEEGDGLFVWDGRPARGRPCYDGKELIKGDDAVSVEIELLEGV